MIPLPQVGLEHFEENADVAGDDDTDREQEATGEQAIVERDVIGRPGQVVEGTTDTECFGNVLPPAEEG